MNRKLKMLVMLLLVSATTFAQGLKVGYTYLDLVVFNMPEMIQINADLKVFEAQLGSLVNTKKVELDNKMNEYQVMAQQPNPIATILQEKVVEIQRLEADYQDFSNKSQQSLVARQSELYGPVYTKVLKAIEDVRAEKGYVMILNSQNQDGSPLVLAADDADNITEAVFLNLGVSMPTQEPAPTDSTGSGN